MKANRLLISQLVLALAALTGCDAGSPDHQHAQLASLQFDVPLDWHRSDTSQRGFLTSVWTPEDNPNKESVTVVRTEMGAAVAAAGGQSALMRLLDQAQRAFNVEKPGVIVPMFTPHGLAGARSELDYLPPGVHEPYHRVHAVLVDGVALVHVLYTAKTPDAGLDAFNTVLSSIHEVSP